MDTFALVLPTAAVATANETAGNGSMSEPQQLQEHVKGLVSSLTGQHLQLGCTKVSSCCCLMLQNVHPTLFVA